MDTRSSLLKGEEVGNLVQVIMSGEEGWGILA